MKKTGLLLLILSIAGLSFGFQESFWGVKNSSFTSTIDTLVWISSSDGGDILHSIIIGDCSPTVNSDFRIYDGSGSAARLIAAIDTSTNTTGGGVATPGGGVGDCRAQYNFGLYLSSGLTYTNFGSSTTILWSNEGL